MKTYALYKNDDLIATGTVSELAEMQGVKESTILFYGSPTYAKRIKNNGLSLVDITPEEEKICPGCSEEKPLSQFYKRKSNNTTQSYCKECTKAAKKKKRYTLSEIDAEKLKAKNDWHQILRLIA